MNEQLPPAEATPVDLIAHDDEVHRHIGCIVRVASHVEDAATQLLSWLINQSDPQKARPLLNGKRLSELIDLLKQLLPEFTDRASYIAALRELNTYRDQLAHSTRGLVPEDIGDYRVHWMDNQRRKERSKSKLDLTQARTIEAHHGLLLAILESLMVGLIVPSAEGAQPTSILGVLQQEAARKTGLWQQDDMLEAAAKVLELN